MKKHYLKTWPEYFEEVLAGTKRFEVRRNDRGFKKGDILILQEYIPEESSFTGRQISCLVTYFLHGQAFGISSGHCVMSIYLQSESADNCLKKLNE